MISIGKKNWIRTLILIVAVIIAVSSSSAQGIPPVVASASYSIPSTGLTTPATSVVDSCGNIYTIDSNDGNLYEIPSGGGTATQIASSGSGGTTSIAIDAARGNLYIPIRWNSAVNEIPIYSCNLNTAGETKVGNSYGSLSYWYDPLAVAVDAAGDLFVSSDSACCSSANEIAETTAAGLNQIVISSLSAPATSMAADLVKNLFYISGGALYELTYTATSSTAGTYAATPLSFTGSYNSYLFSSSVAGVSVDTVGNLYISDKGASIIYEVPYETTASGNTTSSALNFNHMYVVRSGVSVTSPVSFDANNTMYFSPATGTEVNEMTVNKVNFGTVASGSTAQQSLSYQFNDATTFGTVTIPANAGVYSIQSSTCQASTAYAANTSCTQTVQYSPSKPGTDNEGIEVGGTDSANLINVALIGTSQAASTNVDPGVASVLGSGLSAPSAITVDATGDLYIADSKADAVLEFTPGSTKGVSIGKGLKSPSGVAVNGFGNVYIADTGNSQIVEVPTIQGALSNAAQFVALKSTDVLGTVVTTTTTGTDTTTTTTPGMVLKNPTGIALDSNGSLLIADTGNNRIVYVPYTSGAFSVSNSLPVGTSISSPLAVALDPSGNLYVANSGSGQLLRFPSGYATTSQELVADGYSNPSGLTTDAAGTLFLVDQGNQRMLRIPSLNGNLDLNNATEVGSSIADPYGIAIDASGTLYVTDSTNAAAYSITRNASTQDFGNWAVNATSGDLPFTISNSGNASLTLNSPYITLSGNSEDFAILTDSDACASGASIAAGNSCQLAATFTPIATGTRSETIVLNSNAVNDPTQVVFSGTGAVNGATTTTLALSDPASGAPYFGEPITASVTVAANSGSTVPTGNVILLVDGTEIRSVSLSGGKASFKLATGLTGGNHSLLAIYEADSGFTSSNSNVLNLQVSTAPTTTTTTLSTSYVAPYSVPVGSSITVTATIASKGVGIPTGTVSFTLTPASGSAIIATGQVQPAAGGVFQASCTTSSLVVPAGSSTNTYTVSATYGGDTNYNSSTAATQTLYATVVNDLFAYSLYTDSTNSYYPIDSSTNLTVTQSLNGKSTTSTAPSIANNETVDAYVTALNQSFTTSSFTNVVATWSLGVLTIKGPYLTVTGTVAQNIGTTTPKTITSTPETVNGSASVAASSLNLTAGTTSTSITFTATSFGGWTGIVSFYCDSSTLPANSQCVWSPAQLSLSASTTKTTYPTLSSTLTVVTKHDKSPVLSSGFAGWLGGLFCLTLCLIRKRMKIMLVRIGMVVVILSLGVTAVAGLSACGSTSGLFTPTGTSQVKVIANMQSYESGTSTNYPCTSLTASPCNQQTFNVALTVK